MDRYGTNCPGYIANPVTVSSSVKTTAPPSAPNTPMPSSSPSSVIGKV